MQAPSGKHHLSASVSLQPILSNTYGCIVYQEQVIEIFRKLAGYSLGQADMVRRAISKKKGRSDPAGKEAFLHGDAERGICGCVNNGIPEQTAQDIYQQIYDFANYAFNKAHAVTCGGGLIKRLTSCLIQRIHGCPADQRAGIPTKSPSILMNAGTAASAFCRRTNYSDDTFTVEDGGIRFGLVAM